MIEQEFMELVVRRPKVALRRTDNPVLRCAVNEYRYNRKRAEQYVRLALENVRQAFRRG